MRKRKHSTVSRCIVCSPDLISPATLSAGLGRAGRSGSPIRFTLTIDRPKLTPENEKQLMEAPEKAADRR